MTEPVMENTFERSISLSSAPSTVVPSQPPDGPHVTEVDTFLEASALAQYKYVLRSEGYEDLADLATLAFSGEELFQFLIPRPGHRAKLQRLLQSVRGDSASVACSTPVAYGKPFEGPVAAAGPAGQPARAESVWSGAFSAIGSGITRPISARESGIALKIVVVGQPGCGKTCFIRRLVHGDFDPLTRATLGVEFSEKRVYVGGVLLRLHFWDVWGQEHSTSATRSYYQMSRGAIVMYDAADRVSLDRAAAWKADIDAKVTFGEASLPIPAILVGSKYDCCATPGSSGPTERTTIKSVQEIQDICNLYGFVGHFFTSALTGTGVSDSLEFLVSAMLKMDPLYVPQPSVNCVRFVDEPRALPGLTPTQKGKKRKRCCFFD